MIMTREVYDSLSKDIRQQIKSLQKRQKDLDRYFISELPFHEGDTIRIGSHPPMIVGMVRINSYTAPYKTIVRGVDAETLRICEYELKGNVEIIEKA